MAATSSDGSSNGDDYMAPHILAMSATLIPRTLALTLYGYVFLTQIEGDELYRDNGARRLRHRFLQIWCKIAAVLCCFWAAV